MSKLHFAKMHGCGNDFAVFADLDNRISWEELSRLAPLWCDRRFGIGADGLIAVGAPDGADYEMRYVNADGSRAEMCGNGIRCVGKFVADELGDGRDEVRVLTGNGVLTVGLLREGGLVVAARASMGVPRLGAGQIPTTLSPEHEQVIEQPLTVGRTQLTLTTVNMGNPHAVAFVREITDEQVLTLGPQVETHSEFPQKTNVEFVTLLDSENGQPVLRMRVWERGCGETWACGTGACASHVAAVLTGRVQQGEDSILRLNGGDLTISWPDPSGEVYMTGPAVTVYRGSIDPPV